MSGFSEGHGPPVSSINTAPEHAVSADPDKHSRQDLIDLSRTDNSEYQVGRSRLVWAAWHFVGAPVLRSNLLPIADFKCFILRLFGARIGIGVNIKPGVRVKFPWYLSVGDYSWIGEDVWIDNLALVSIGRNVCISQGAYLCTGNHDWKSWNMRLFRRPIILQDGCWVGAQSRLCPGVTLGLGSIAAVGSVITKDIPAFEIWAGNPAHYVRQRTID